MEGSTDPLQLFWCHDVEILSGDPGKNMFAFSHFMLQQELEL